MAQRKKRKMSNMRLYLTYYSIVDNIDIYKQVFLNYLCEQLNVISVHINNIFAVNALIYFFNQFCRHF